MSKIAAQSTAEMLPPDLRSRADSAPLRLRSAVSDQLTAAADGGHLTVVSCRWSDSATDQLTLLRGCAVRCVDCNGNGAVAQFIAGLEWVAGHYQLPAVASMSLGSNSINEALDSALQAVVALGVVGVVAAGNYGSGARSGAALPNPAVLNHKPWTWCALRRLATTAEVHDLSCGSKTLQY